jgi:DNA-binding MarR family transcriptional regulator
VIGLTQRQAQVLQFIEASHSQRQYPPTLREIGTHMGIRSTNGVNDHLRALETKGYISRDGMSSRGIRVLRTGVGAIRSAIDQEEAARAVAKIVAGSADALRARETWIKRQALPKTKGPIVYFIQSNLGGPIKIGTTTDLRDRLVQIQATSPLPLVVLSIQRGNASCEAMLHERFRSLRLHGEWFFPGEELLSYLTMCVRLAEPVK